MAELGSSGKIPLTLPLPAEVAARLKLAAEAQKRPAAELAVDLLDRYSAPIAGRRTEESQHPVFVRLSPDRVEASVRLGHARHGHRIAPVLSGTTGGAASKA